MANYSKLLANYFPRPSFFSFSIFDLVFCASYRKKYKNKKVCFYILHNCIKRHINWSSIIRKFAESGNCLLNTQTWVGTPSTPGHSSMELISSWGRWRAWLPLDYNNTKSWSQCRLKHVINSFMKLMKLSHNQ